MFSINPEHAKFRTSAPETSETTETEDQTMRKSYDMLNQEGKEQVAQGHKLQQEQDSKKGIEMIASGQMKQALARTIAIEPGEEKVNTVFVPKIQKEEE